MPFRIGHPPPTHQMQSICVREDSRVPNLQTEFNYLDSFKSYCIFSDFVVPTSSLLSPRQPHTIPRRSSCGVHTLHGCGLRCLHPMSLLSPCCPCHPPHPHVVPVIPMSSPHHPHSAQKVLMWSPHPPWLWSPLSPPHVPVVSMLSPHCLHVVPVIPTSSLSSPHHPHII